jgi:hypothetical protein
VPHTAELYPWLSVAAIAWGVLDCFFGYRVFRVTLVVLGGCAGALFGQAAGMALDLGAAGEIGGLIAGALLGAGVALLLYIVAVFLVGFGFGATLGILLLAHLHQTVALLAGGLLGLIGGVAAVKLQRVLIVLSTALLGAFRAVIALGYFTSQIDWLYYFQQPEQIPALITSKPWIFPSILALAAVGVMAQFEFGTRAGDKPDKKSAE